MKFQEEIDNVMLFCDMIDNDIKKLKARKDELQGEFIKSQATLEVGKSYMVTFPNRQVEPQEIKIEKIGIELMDEAINIKDPGPVFTARWDIQYTGRRVQRKKDGELKKVQNWSLPVRIPHSKLDKYIIEVL